MDWLAGSIPLIITGLLLTLAALSLPWRRRRSFSLERVVPASREDVWTVCDHDPENPRCAAVYPHFIERRRLGGDPPVEEYVIDGSRGHRTQLLTVRTEGLVEIPNERSCGRLTQYGEMPYPFGPDHRADLELEDHPGGTLVRLSWQGETRTLWQYLGVRNGNKALLERIAKYSPPEAELPKPGADRRPGKSIALTVLAVVSFGIWLGWGAAALIIGTLVVHEFGHWLAFRLTGHPAPRIMLIPFFGGVAIGNHPHRTQFDAAFVALMGPAFSLLALAAMLIGVWVTLPWIFTTPPDAWVQTVQQLPDSGRYGWYLMPAIFMLSAINLLQLLPIAPLDGGQVLQAAMHSAGPRIARWTVMAFAATGVAAALWFGDIVIAAIAAVGFLGAWHMDTGVSDVRPMGFVGLSVIGIGYLATALIYLAVVLVTLVTLNIL